MTELEILLQQFSVQQEMHIQLSDIQTKLFEVLQLQASFCDKLSDFVQYQLILLGLVGILVMVVMLRD